MCCNQRTEPTQQQKENINQMLKIKDLLYYLKINTTGELKRKRNVCGYTNHKYNVRGDLNNKLVILNKKKVTLTLDMMLSQL